MTESLTQAQENLLQYIKMIAEFNKNRQQNDYGDILARGRFWTPQVLPKQYKVGAMRLCFQNAFHLANDSGGELRYCEGIANAIIPTHHAWCVDKSGNVVDPTWRTRKGSKYVHKVEDLAYYGIVYNDIEEVLTQVLRQGHYGMLLGNRI